MNIDSGTALHSYTSESVILQADQQISSEPAEGLSLFIAVKKSQTAVLGAFPKTTPGSAPLQ